MAKTRSEKTDSGGKKMPDAKKKKTAKKQSPAMKPATGAVKKPNAVASRETRRSQKPTASRSKPPRSFVRLVRDVAQKINPDMKFTADAIMALQDASKAILLF